jgi:hypothetical protein
MTHKPRDSTCCVVAAYHNIENSRGYIGGVTSTRGHITDQPTRASAQRVHMRQTNTYHLTLLGPIEVIVVVMPAQQYQLFGGQEHRSAERRKKMMIFHLFL